MATDTQVAPARRISWATLLGALSLGVICLALVVLWNQLMYAQRDLQRKVFDLEKRLLAERAQNASYRRELSHLWREHDKLADTVLGLKKVLPLLPAPQRRPLVWRDHATQ